MKFKVVNLFVAVSLTMTVFFWLCPQGETPRYYDGNPNNIFLFSLDSNHQIFSHEETAKRLIGVNTWNTRYGGCWITGELWNLFYSDFLEPVVINGHSVELLKYQKVSAASFANYCVLFAGYNSAWLFLLFIIYIIHRPDSILLSALTVCGLLYNGEQAGQWICPWDYPAMFFFGWSVLLFLKKEWTCLALILFIGSFFKETVGLCAILFLFAEMTIKRRLIWFASSCIACLILRISTERLLGYAGSTFSAWHEWSHNIDYIFSLCPNQFWFTNCGTVALLWFMPLHRGLKVLALIFLTAQFLFGNLDETRVCFEILPLGLVGLSEFVKQYQSKTI